MWMAAVAAVQAYGSIMQGQATADALNKQAKLQEQNAREAEIEGQLNAQKSSLISGKRIGSEQAGYGASGVTSASGSVLSVLTASASNAEMDRLNVLHGADLRAIQNENQASMERVGAGNAITGSLFNAAGSIGKTAAIANSGNGDSVKTKPQQTEYSLDDTYETTGP